MWSAQSNVCALYKNSPLLLYYIIQTKVQKVKFPVLLPHFTIISQRPICNYYLLFFLGGGGRIKQRKNCMYSIVICYSIHWIQTWFQFYSRIDAKSRHGASIIHLGDISPTSLQYWTDSPNVEPALRQRWLKRVTFAVNNCSTCSLWHARRCNICTETLLSFQYNGSKYHSRWRSPLRNEWLRHEPLVWLTSYWQRVVVKIKWNVRGSSQCVVTDATARFGWYFQQTR